MVFFDAFCGMGSVCNAVKEYHDVVFNDTLNCCYTYTYGRLIEQDCTFARLGFNPFDYLNSQKNHLKVFSIKTILRQNQNECIFLLKMQVE